MKARVWSSRTSPGDSVAHAVRASCTIPLFFQPVEQGNALLVDGGVVSNIPHFVFSGEALQSNKARKRVLLFMLEATEERRRAESALELIGQLASIVVDGGSSVQLAFSPDLARVVIPTDAIRATDFEQMDSDKVTMLISNGRRAAQAFIADEIRNTRSSSTELRPIMDEFEAYLVASEQLHATTEEVRIAMPNSKWFWELFPPWIGGSCEYS